MERRFNFSIGEYYHIYTRGVEKRKIFSRDKDYERFINLLYVSNNKSTIHLSNFTKFDYKDFFAIERPETLVDIGSYCLMPNHFHLLVKEKVNCGISKFMGKLLTGYSMYFNIRNHRSGPLFVRPFRARYADSDRYLKYLFAYINLNAIDIFLPGWSDNSEVLKNFDSNFLGKYKYSSYQDFLGIKRPENVILNKKEFPEYFQTKAEFDTFLNECLSYKSEIEAK